MPPITPARIAVADANVLTNLIHVQRNSRILATSQAISRLQVPRFLKVIQQGKLLIEVRSRPGSRSRR